MTVRFLQLSCAAGSADLNKTLKCLELEPAMGLVSDKAGLCSW